MTKAQVIEKLKNWSENAIMCAEIDADPDVTELRQLVQAGVAAGMIMDEINELIWTPYTIAEVSNGISEDSYYTVFKRVR